VPRVAAIAIDAAEWWYVHQRIEAGDLPNLAGLLGRSAAFELRAPMAFRSELSWARFLTGQEPLDDGDWAASMVFDPDTYAIATTTASTRPKWYELGPGTKVVTLDLIQAVPADGVDGVQVGAWGSHSPQWPRTSKPPGLLREIDATFGTNPAFDNDSGLGWYQPDYVDALAGASETGLARRADIARWLLERDPDWDLLLLCMSEVHGAGHLMWHGVDPASPLHGARGAGHAGRRFDDVLRAADAAVGQVLDVLAPDTNVVVFALHGAQPADDLLCTVLLPELLHRKRFGAGLLRSPDAAAWRRRGCPPIVPPPDYPWGELLSDLFADTPKQRARRAVRRVLPRPAFESLRRIAGRPVEPPLHALHRPTPEPVDEPDDADLARYRAPVDYQVPAWYARHWPSMPAFAVPTFADGHVRINLAGRERDGLVEPDDYKRACDDVETLLRECRDARTGDPVVGEVLRTRAGDPMDPGGPDCDLLVLWDGAPDAIEHPELGVIGPFPHLRTSHHSNHGFALVSGPGVAPGARGTRSTLDLPPTLLTLLQRPTAGLRGTSLV
jgi:predicted AlkP superfamily phosphohydrolase/phosphomutase